MKYCSIHGPIDDAETAGRDYQTACPRAIAGGTCNTALTNTPDAKWQAEFERRRTTTEPYQPPIVNPIDQLGDAGRSNAAPHVNARTRAKQGAFLAAFAQIGRVDLAAQAAGIDRGTHYEWLKTDKEYPALFEEAQELGAQLLMDEAVRRAIHGWEEPMSVAGEKVMVRKFSDRLLERLLEAHYPLKFRSNMAHRLVDKAGNDRKLLDFSDLDALIKAADERDKGN